MKTTNYNLEDAQQANGGVKKIRNALNQWFSKCGLGATVSLHSQQQESTDAASVSWKFILSD